jgi:hypothetical protein
VIRTSLLLLALLGAEKPSLEALLPTGAKALWLVRFDARTSDQQAVLALDARGTPWLASKAALLPLDSSGKPFRVPQPIDAFAFSSENVLAVVCGKTLAIVSKEGFVPVAELPRAGFRIAAAGADAFLLFEGKDLYRFKAGGKVEHLLASPEPVDAVASTGEQTWLSSAGAVLTLEPEPKRLFLAADPITSLAVAEGGALFYATATEVGFAAGEGRAPFLKGAAATVHARGDRVYLHVLHTGVVAIEPISAFAAFADVVKKAKETKR